MDGGGWWAAVHGVARSCTRLCDFTFTFHFPCIGEGNGNPLQYSCLENPRDGKPGGLPSMGPHRVGHDWSDLAAAAANTEFRVHWKGGQPWSEWTGPRWSPAPMNSFFMETHCGIEGDCWKESRAKRQRRWEDATKLSWNWREGAMSQRMNEPGSLYKLEKAGNNPPKGLPEWHNPADTSSAQWN